MASPSQPPSVWAIAFATALLAGVAGYFAGQASAIGVFAPSSSKSRSGATAAAAKDSDLDSDAEEEQDEKQEGLEGFKDRAGEACKLVLVVRTDLGMTKGKIAAQCGHATLACYKTLAADEAGRAILARWERYGQAKIAVQVKSEEDMLVLQAQAVSLGVCARVIHDAGRTQIASGSATVLGVGPAPEGVVNMVTGQLKLL